MQEPDILSLFQTISKAEPSLSFFRDEVPTRAISDKSYYQNRAGHGAGDCNGDVLAGEKVYLLLYTIYSA
jgi:hypothetical protein